MQVSKTRFQEMKEKLSRAMSKARSGGGPGRMDAVDLGVAFAEGIGAGVVSSYVVGAIPTPASMSKIARPLKAAVQAGLGLTSAYLFKKNKHALALSMGVAITGGLGLIEVVAKIPTMAGEVDEVMYSALAGPLGGSPMGAPMGGNREPALNGQSGSGPSAKPYDPFGA